MNVRNVKSHKMQNILLHSRKYREERIRLKQKISQTGRKLSIESVQQEKRSNMHKMLLWNI